MAEMTTKMDATLEHLRIGAIKGQILDADGSAVIYDLFTEFGVTAHAEIDFDLDNAGPAPGAVKTELPSFSGRTRLICLEIASEAGTVTGYGRRPGRGGRRQSAGSVWVGWSG